MTKQRPSFFVDDILHMVMPINTNTNNNLKRKRSINSKDDKRNEEEITNKKFRSYDANDKSNYSQVLDIIGDDGAGEEESCISDNSNNIDDNSGKLFLCESDVELKIGDSLHSKRTR
jgi:hypothetical protein